MKILDSAHRPPAFVMSPHASSWLVEGDCAPSYLEVWLDPLGAYRLLGLPVNELSGQLTDLADVLGGAARRLAGQLRETPGWRQRFALMDQFLLRRMACGPRRVRHGAGQGGPQHRVIEGSEPAPVRGGRRSEMEAEDLDEQQLRQARHHDARSRWCHLGLLERIGNVGAYPAGGGSVRRASTTMDGPVSPKEAEPARS